jgi:hypothetical protein
VAAPAVVTAAALVDVVADFELLQPDAMIATDAATVIILVVERMNLPLGWFGRSAHTGSAIS